MPEEKEGHVKEEKGKGGSNSKILIVIGALIILVLAVVIIVQSAKLRNVETATANGQKKEVVEGKKVVVDNSAAEEAARALINPTEPDKYIPQRYTVTQNSDWSFSDGETASTNAFVENDKENETPIYFDVIVDETGETVYSSPILELGAVLDNIKLDVDLDAGAYPCTVVYHLVDENQETLTTVNVGVNLLIEN